MYARGEEFRQILNKTRKLCVTSPADTDLTMSLAQSVLGNVFNQIARKKSTQIWQTTGILKRRVGSSFMGGQIAFVPASNSLQGRAIVDGYLWPPKELRRLPEPISWQFANSRLIQMEGPANITQPLEHFLAAQQIGIEHFCLGFHSNAQLASGILEPERIFGAIAVGIGRGACHTDDVMTNLPIEVDGKLIQENRHCIHPTLRKLQHQLTSRKLS